MVLHKGCPKWFGVAPSVSDGRIEAPLAERELYNGTVLHRAVQNMQNRCPKWGRKVLKFGPACGSRDCGI